jgi:hypothetical protein
MKNYVSWIVPIIMILFFEGCATSSLHKWTFKERPSASVVSEKKIVQGFLPILYVFRDSVDGQWIFLFDEKSGGDEVVIVTLEEIVKIDASVKQLSDLPAGWKAWREAKNTPWSRSKLTHEHN